MAQSNRKQHYIPQCYLRNFSDDGKFLWVYNKSTSKAHTQAISNTAFMKDFYRIADKVIDGKLINDVNRFEKEFFANSIEPQFNSYLNLIKNKTKDWLSNPNHSPVLDRETKELFSAFIAIQHLRMPNIKDMHIDAMKKANQERFEIIKSFYKSTRNEVDQDCIDNISMEYDDELNSLEHFYVYGDQELINSIQDQLINKIWIFYVSEDKNVFTSDNPILRKPHLENQPSFYDGFGMKGVEVIFPLNSSLVLTMWDEECFSERVDEDNKFQLITPKLLRQYNSYQYLYSNYQTYCQNNDFGLIELLKIANGGKEYFHKRPKIYVNGK